MGTSGLLQLWQSKGGAPKVNPYSMPLEVPPMRAESLHPKAIDTLDMSEMIEAACPQGCPSLGEDVAGGPLLSAWPEEEKFTRCSRRPAPIHPDFLTNLQMNDFAGYAQNVHG